MEQETKISELTGLPGALDPAALLAIVQGGVTYHATGEQVSNMVLGNISVVENSNGIAVRFPESQLQVAFLTRGLVEVSLAAGASASLAWEFPAPFNEHPAISLQMYNPHGTTVYPRFVGYNGQGATEVTIQVLDLRTSGTAQSAHVSGIAVGTYTD